MNSRSLDNQANRQDDDFHRRISDLWDHLEETALGTPKESTKEDVERPQQLTQEEVPEEPSKSERRQCERHGYPSIQKLAPCDLFQLPKEHAFRDARFHDISRGGVSFFWAEPPDFEFVAIFLGDGHRSVAVKARVVRHQAIVGLQNEYLVCCEFVRRFDGLCTGES